MNPYAPSPSSASDTRPNRSFSPQPVELADFPDAVTARETVVLISFVLLAISLGLFPQSLLLSWMEPSVTAQVEALGRLGP
jgi:NADH:ubiquinone oxidoreductase subunit 4 (subunit M)